MPSYSRKVEALAEAITKFTGYHDPASPLHSSRNPGNILATSPDHRKDAEGRRVFASFLDGYQSLLHDLTVKLSGRSRSGLTASSSLADLAAARQENNPPVLARQWALFLRAALNDPSLTATTQLSYFLEQ